MKASEDRHTLERHCVRIQPVEGNSWYLVLKRTDTYRNLWSAEYVTTQSIIPSILLTERAGIEELKKEIRVRNAQFIPLEVSAKKANEISQVLAHRILATFTPTVMFSLNQEFHFGKDRLLRWKDAFINLCNMMDAIDPFGCQYETARDYAEVLKQKYGIEFDWDSIDEVIGLNQKKRGQMCDIDYVISFLEEKGQKKAAQLIREYGKR